MAALRASVESDNTLLGGLELVPEPQFAEKQVTSNLTASVVRELVMLKVLTWGLTDASTV